MFTNPDHSLGVFKRCSFVVVLVVKKNAINRNDFQAERLKELGSAMAPSAYINPAS